MEDRRAALAWCEDWPPLWRLSAPGSGRGLVHNVELKMLDAGSLGATIQMLRFRPGASTPTFKIPGHTHLFVLQGSGTIQPAGSAPVAVNKYDYAFLPENFAVTLSNAQQYEGPGAQ